MKMPVLISWDPLHKALTAVIFSLYFPISEGIAAATKATALKVWEKSILLLKMKKRGFLSMPACRLHWCFSMGGCLWFPPCEQLALTKDLLHTLGRSDFTNRSLDY